MLTDDDKKLLTELLGEVFHGYTDDVTPDGQWRMRSCYAFIRTKLNSTKPTTLTGSWTRSASLSW